MAAGSRGAGEVHNRKVLLYTCVYRFTFVLALWRLTRHTAAEAGNGVLEVLTTGPLNFLEGPVGGLLGVVPVVAGGRGGVACRRVGFCESCGGVGVALVQGAFWWRCGPFAAQFCCCSDCAGSLFLSGHG